MRPHGLEAAAAAVWSGATPATRLARAALRPAAAAYGAAVAARNLLYDRGCLTPARVPARVLAVGNLTVGGCGKTPTALWLATELAARGRRVAIVARGYRKRRRGVVVVGTQGAALVGPEEGGDEAVLLARRFAGPVVTGEGRAAAAALAVERFAVDTVVLDDGFQHRALARDADLVLVPEDGLPARLLPAGPLREPVTALARAHAALAVGRGGAFPALPAVPSGVAAFRGRFVPTALVAAAEGGWREEPVAALAGRRVTAVAGVARPGAFVALLQAAGAVVERVLAFPDHCAYDDVALRMLGGAAAGGDVVVTEKDLVKLAGRPGTGGLRALRITLEVEDGARLIGRLAGAAGLDLCAE
ncbi:MAG TPA: tetraacyldisaccharide 4'-kinase [Candidatus Binatia bacterium]|nr:tetraacyldisaccharide 4'-kinase [Candidatus Binatia bacterium]